MKYKLTVKQMREDLELLEKINAGLVIAHDDGGDQVLGAFPNGRVVYRDRLTGGAVELRYPDYWIIEIDDRQPPPPPGVTRTTVEELAADRGLVERIRRGEVIATDDDGDQILFIDAQGRARIRFRASGLEAPFEYLSGSKRVTLTQVDEPTTQEYRVLTGMAGERLLLHLASGQIYARADEDGVFIPREVLRDLPRPAQEKLLARLDSLLFG